MTKSLSHQNWKRNNEMETERRQLIKHKELNKVALKIGHTNLSIFESS